MSISIQSQAAKMSPALQDVMRSLNGAAEPEQTFRQVVDGEVAESTVLAASTWSGNIHNYKFN